MDNILYNDTQVNCSGIPGGVDTTSPWFIIPCIILGILNSLVIFGNGLVIAAVFTSHKLRTVTHGFIVSLAVADLLVGVFVLPFSSANEVLK